MKHISSFLLIGVIWSINALFKLIPIKLCWRGGELLGSFLYVVLASKRRVVRENLQVVGSKYPSVDASDKQIRKIFRRSFANLACGLKTYGMTPYELDKTVDIEIPDGFVDSAQNGNGSVNCLAHMGNWEILSKVFPIATPAISKFGAVYRPLRNQRLNEYVLKERERFGCKMFAKHTSVMALSQFVKEGGQLGILADQRAGRNRKYARPFFDRDSARSKLPALLQKRSKAPIYIVSCHSDRPAHWQIKFTPVEITSDNTEEILEAITAEYENAFRTHVIDVFWLHRYWALDD